MYLLKNIVGATVLTGVLAVANFGTVEAGDSSPVWRLMKPLYAISFDVGRKHVLTYFLRRKNGLCDLTMIVSDRLMQFHATTKLRHGKAFALRR